MIQIKNITRHFRSNFWEKEFTALDDVSFQITAGKVTGFLGANGAGKTTLLKILMGFIKANSGDIQFSSELGTSQNEIFGKLGYLPERPYFYPYLSGHNFLKFMGELNNVPTNILEKNIQKYSKTLKIDHALNRLVRGYSKGMLQRLGLISVLLHDPELIILDEPLSGLDPIGRKEFKNIFMDLKNQGKTLFFSSHIVNDIEEVCENVVVLENGKLFYQGAISDLVEENKDLLYEIQYLDKNMQKQTESVAHIKKDAYIKNLCQQDSEILSVNPIIPSLEEIIYKIKVGNEKV